MPYLIVITPDCSPSTVHVTSDKNSDSSIPGEHNNRKRYLAVKLSEFFSAVVGRSVFLTLVTVRSPLRIQNAKTNVRLTEG